MTTYAAECIDNGNDVLEVAALMVRIGLEIYRSSLEEEDYYKIVDFISDNSDKISPIESPTKYYQ
jgi:hypothetical protein